VIRLRLKPNFMFKLLRYFSITSLIACSATTAVLWNYYREQSVHQLIGSTQQQNIAIANVLSNSLWQEHRPFLTESIWLTPDELLKHPETQKLNHLLLKSLQDNSVKKVTIINLNGRIIFSTDNQAGHQVGHYVATASGFIDGRVGKVTTFGHRPDNTIARDLVTGRLAMISSYIPIRPDGPQGKIEGVMEVSKDITDLMTKVENTQSQILGVLLFTLSWLYIALFLIVYRGNKILEGQMDEIESQVAARQLTEATLQQKMEQLARSNAELEQFAYVASHDLQEPLRKIEAFGDRLKIKCSKDLSDRGVEYIDRMQNAAGRMRILIQDLLEFSQVASKSQPFSAVNLKEVVAGVLSDLETRIDETQSAIHVGELPILDADPLQMRQLFQNLIGNAMKFRRLEEPLKIEIKSKSLQIMGNNGQPKGMDVCQITIADNGIGFEQKYTDRIFRVFQRLHSRSDYDGTGIGLSVCTKIAERHGGSITAESIPGQGATFIVTLPIQQSEIGNPACKVAEVPL
jgi:signal transduction histidine kinase